MCFSLVQYMLIYCKNWRQKMPYCLYCENMSHGRILPMMFCLSLKLQFAALCLPYSGKFSFQIFTCNLNAMNEKSEMQARSLIKNFEACQ